MATGLFDGRMAKSSHTIASTAHRPRNPIIITPRLIALQQSEKLGPRLQSLLTSIVSHTSAPLRTHVARLRLTDGSVLATLGSHVDNKKNHGAIAGLANCYCDPDAWLAVRGMRLWA
jgi:hypothetical protein